MDEPRRQGSTAMWLLFALAGIIAFGAPSITGALRGPDAAAMAGAAAVGPVLFLCALALSLRPRTRAADAVLDGALSRIERSVARLEEQNALSEGARRILNRQRERELLRRAIEEDIAGEDWDAALVLIDELARNFGYRADAEEFRDRIQTARFETLNRRVSAAIAHLDALIAARRWDAASEEAGRIRRLYPDSPRVEDLRGRVEHARAVYRDDLERRFLDAAREERIEEAMELLKELDAYLTEAQAEPYRELARGVIGKARDNLGVQFKSAVRDRRWSIAADAGARIIAEFPNSRMAVEVRQVIDSIRERARSA